MVGNWSIPLVVDGKPQMIEGRLWRAAKPSLWPWLLVWLIAVFAAAAALRAASRRLRLRLLALGAPVCAVLVLAVSVGFTSSSARSGWTRWFDLAFPAALAAVAALVPFLRARHRVSSAACVAGFAFAAALQNVPVFAHGFVVSWLPAEVVRAAVAVALATGGFVLVLALAELWQGTPHERGRPVPRPHPRMAIPRGRTR